MLIRSYATVVSDDDSSIITEIDKP